MEQDDPRAIDALTPSQLNRSTDATPLRVNTAIPATGIARVRDVGKSRHGTASHERKRTEEQARLREKYYLGVKIRHVNICQRSAFRWPPLPSEDEVISEGTNTSPSLNHLKILRAIQSNHVVRQIHFSPGLGGHADVKFPDGGSRFPAIEPPVLPSPAPRYNPRHRLPNRADVGFPNPSLDEIKLKQQEIRDETLWEEFSPRLIVHFPRFNSEDLLLEPEPNPSSMLAPPLGATFSPSQGWRPRAIHDRPTGRQYCIASCLTVFEKASLTLFTLPPLYRDKHPLNAAAAAAYHCRNRNIKPAYGKMSEEFWIQASPSFGVFSFDPMELPMESNKKNAILHHSIYLVLRVYAEEGELRYFGVTKFFRNQEAMEWPAAIFKDINLYAFQGVLSNDSFVEVLWSIVHQRYVMDGAGSVDDISIDSKRSDHGVAKRSTTPPPTIGSRNRHFQVQKKQARVLLSGLGTDFLRCLLYECKGVSIPTPRLLVDVSGQEGIRLEGVGKRQPKRSDLQRIPTDGEIGQFREVCYLPPQCEKNHNIDCVLPGSLGVFNLLFLYPRRIRCTMRNGRFQLGVSYKIRIQCLKEGQELQNFQAPGGQTSSYMTKPVQALDLSGDLSFFEEVKLTLPKVITGSFRLVFALFCDDVPVAQASMPLCRTDDFGKARIVIPNGKHRLDLHDFQFQVDTRVVSSLHIANQDVADALFESNQAIFKLPKLTPGSGSSTLAHFYPLLHLLLSSLVTAPSENMSWELVEHLFVVIERTREYFDTRHKGVIPFSHFLKCHIDILDEKLFSNNMPLHEMHAVTEDVDENVVWDFPEMVDDEVSILSLAESARRHQKLRNPTRKQRSGEKALFTRVPYGATKVDRMKAEAELEEDQNQYAPFFEDDETIATAPSFYSEKRASGSKRIGIEMMIRETRNDATEDDGDFLAGGNISLDERLRSIGETTFAKKFRTAASVVLAPCVGPTLPNFLRQSSHSTQYKNISNGSESLFESLQKGACFCPPGSVVGDDPATATNNPLNERLWDESRLLHGSSKIHANSNTANRPNGVFHSLLSFFSSRWNSGDIRGSLEDDKIVSFLENLDIILALALKSLILVYFGSDGRGNRDPVVALAENHFVLVNDFTGNVVEALINQSVDIGDQFEVLLDFVVGLFSILIDDQAKTFCVRFIGSLSQVTTTISLESKSFYARFKTARRFLSLPCFVELNQTSTVLNPQPSLPSVKVSWLLQSLETIISNDLSQHTGIGPQFWMSNLFLRDSLETSVAATQLIMKETTKSCHRNKTTADDETYRKYIPCSEMLLLLHKSAIGGIAVVHELLLRRLAVDVRYQGDAMKARISSMFLPPLLEVSLEYSDVLSELPCDHAVRRLWMGCLLHLFQDAPEEMISNHVARLSFNSARQLVSVLHNAGKSFEREFGGTSDTSGARNDTSWVRQECFNIICAALNIVVDIWLSNPTWYLHPLAEEVGSCYLSILSIDQSPVTYLRALGGAMVIVETNVDFFVKSNHKNLESWVRSLLIAMNSISLSVRSIAVDFTLSLVSGIFRKTGNVDSLLLIYATILPTVAAQQIDNLEPGDSSQFVWPLRRSIADIGDVTPEDDPRVDSQLSPSLKLFCRTCQAVIDSVLVEMQLCTGIDHSNTAFTADEESLFEAASFFMAEYAPLQRVRWLLALCLLQESKNHYLEAAESLILVAKTVCDSLLHLQKIWYSTMINHTDGLSHGSVGTSGRTLQLFRLMFAKEGRPSFATMCDILTTAINEAVDLYSREEGMEQLAYSGVEKTLRALMLVIEEHNKKRPARKHNRATLVALRRKMAEEEMCLRRASAALNGAMKSLAEKLLDFAKEESPSGLPMSSKRLRPKYVLLHVHGFQPPGIYENINIPVFLTWGKPCICRVPDSHLANTDDSVLKFAASYVKELQTNVGVSNLIVRTTTSETDYTTDATYLDIFRVEMVDSDPFHTSYASFVSKRFFHKVEGAFVETKVARLFPCALSRQSSLLTTQITLAYEGD